MIAMPQATADLDAQKFNRYLLTFSIRYTKIKFFTICETFLKLKFSKFVLNFRTLNIFGNFFLVVLLCKLCKYRFDWSGKWKPEMESTCY